MIVILLVIISMVNDMDMVSIIFLMVTDIMVSTIMTYQMAMVSTGNYLLTYLLTFK